MIVARSMSDTLVTSVTRIAAMTAMPALGRRAVAHGWPPADGSPPLFRPGAGRAMKDYRNPPAGLGLPRGGVRVLNQGITEQTPADPPASSRVRSHPVLALIRDLMFSSRVTGTAAKLGLPGPSDP